MADNRFLNTAAAEATQVDVGLRSYMLGVYNHMTTALLMTGFFAYAMKFAVMNVAGVGQLVYGTPLKWVVMLAPLGLVFWLSARIQSMSASKARNLFYVYAALMGISLASVLLMFSTASVARAFFITAGAFAGLSLYGYTTKRSLSAMGSFMIIGLFGLIIAMIVNIFVASTAMDLMISVLGVLIFAGLTAWDTQKIKLMYMAGD
ncbi:MAG: Bax inhibitor-1/YccA family protein, partial [Rhodobiaceae bacterium]